MPKPLEAICLKAMSLRPGDRYGKPNQLADDIERWLADERVDLVSVDSVETDLEDIFVTLTNLES